MFRLVLTIENKPFETRDLVPYMYYKWHILIIVI